MDSASVLTCGLQFDSACSRFLRAVSAMHRRGWLHGDVRPSNVAVDAKGVARFFDFSHACKMGDKSEAVSEYSEFEDMVG
jgi:Ser/Thr protein kinase RdoA (MazF antagonist)